MSRRSVETERQKRGLRAEVRAKGMVRMDVTVEEDRGEGAGSQRWPIRLRQPRRRVGEGLRSANANTEGRGPGFAPVPGDSVVAAISDNDVLRQLRPGPPCAP